MRSRLATIMCQIMGESLGLVFLGSCSCGFDIHPQVVIVLHVVAAAVEGMCAIGCAHDRIGSRDSRSPGICSNFFVGDHPFDLNYSTIRRAVEKQVNPSRSSQMLDIAI